MTDMNRADRVGLKEEVAVSKNLMPRDAVDLKDQVSAMKDIVQAEPVYIDQDTVKILSADEAKCLQEKGDRLKKEYDKKAHDLYMEMCREGDVGPSVGVAVFRDLVQEAERSAINVRTIELFLEGWNSNFRENLERGYFKGADGRFIVDHCKPTACMCVGAGPSLSDAQIDLLKGWGGCVICSNKSVKKLLEHGVTPTIITALHSTETVLKSFQHDIVRENLRKSFIMLPTTIHPKVAEELLTYADKEKVFWFHASTPDEFVPNLDNLYQSMVKLPLCDTGGNVGLFNIALCEQLLPKYVGFVGMDLCAAKETVKTNVEAQESTFLYYPEDQQEFVLSKVFRGYVQVMMNWYGDKKREGMKFELYNCTPIGLIYCRRRDWIPYMPLEEFVKKYA